jgi:hypothetical protein
MTNATQTMLDGTKQIGLQGISHEMESGVFLIKTYNWF